MVHVAVVGGGGQGGAMAGEPGFGDASGAGIDGGGEEGVVFEREARAFGDEAFADFRFAEGEMAGAGIEDDIDGAGGEPGAGTTGDPCVFADFKADADAADVEDEIADGERISCAWMEEIGNAGRPGFEPSGFVVDAIAGKVLFGGETC